MHAFTRRLHSKSDQGAVKKMKGLMLNNGWRYDLMEQIFDLSLLRGQVRGSRLYTADLARIQGGEAVLDVGCGTGTLAIEVQRRVGSAGRVVGIDPETRQIARARSKAAWRSMPIDFQVGTIEHLPFPDQMCDVVVSTIMMHHVPESLTRQGLFEITHVLKPAGRLVIADFTRPQERQGWAATFHAGGSSRHDLAALVKDAGFAQVETAQIAPLRSSVFPAAGGVRATKEGAHHG